MGKAPTGFWSTYFYKEQDDDRFYWGPLWDYDIAYNNDNRTDRGGTNSTTRQLMKDYGYGDRGSGCKPWVQQMWRDPWFARLINRRYRELVDGGLEQYLYDKLDSLTTLIDASQQLNYERWGINTRTLRERVLYSSYDRYIDDLRMFIGHHIEFLASAFADLLPDSPDPDPKTPGFQADANSYYAIANAGTGTYFDVNTMIDALCARHRDADSESQQWHLDNLANGYLFLTNRASGKALSDSSPEGTTATTNPGYAIILKDPDSLDVRQQWDFVLQSDGHYNIISRWSQHAANLSGGNAADGTNILSYTSDERNATSANRLWRIELAGTVQNDIADVPWQDYVLAYDPTTQRLHFGTDHPAELRMPVAIYDQRGRRVATFRATDGYNAATLPRGLYIVTWQHHGRQHSVKFMNVER